MSTATGVSSTARHGRRRRLAVTGALVFLAASANATARAQSSGDITRAKALFEEGKRLLEQKQFDKACPVLAESFQLAATTGPLLALAVCHEAQGKTASAWGEYKEVVARVRVQGQAEWADKAERAAAALEPRLPRVTIALGGGAQAVAGLVIRRDGQVVDAGALGAAIAVDPGPHAVEATAPDHQPWQAQIVAVEGTSVSVTVPALAATAASSAPARDTAAPPPRLPLRTIGIAAGAASVVAMGIGAYFGLHAIARNDDSLHDGHCIGDFCDATGKQARLDAISAANASTISFIAGGVLLGGGIALFVLGKPSDASSTPSARIVVRGDGATLGVSGRF